MISASFDLPTSTPGSIPELQAIVKPSGYSYLVSRPMDPSPGSARRWPAIFFLHGAGERGSRVEDVARQGLPKLVQATGELSSTERMVGQEIAARFVVIAPQCPAYEIWKEHELLRVLDEAVAENAVDPAHVYLTGMSMGGFGAWTLGLRHPHRFAALVPICGGGRLTDVASAMSKNKAALSSLGLWAFHGANDRVVPLEESERMVDGLRRVGISGAKLTVYPDGQHDAWSQTYSNPELYRWLLEHKR